MNRQQQQGWRAGQLMRVANTHLSGGHVAINGVYADGGMACGFTLYHKTGGTYSQGHLSPGSMVVGNPRAATQEEAGRYLEALWEATK